MSAAWNRVGSAASSRGTNIAKELGGEFNLAENQAGARGRLPLTRALIVFQRAGRGGVNGKMAAMAVSEDQPGHGA